MSEVIYVYGKESLNLVVDLGLFHVLICSGPRQLLEPVQEKLKNLIKAPLMIVPDENLKGILPDSSFSPNEFEIVTGGRGVPAIFDN
jgi:hypothetical protein